MLTKKANFTLIMLFIALHVLSQTDSTLEKPRWNLKFYPFQELVGRQLLIGFEYFYSAKNSAELEASYIQKDWTELYVEDRTDFFDGYSLLSAKGTTIKLSWKHYPKGIKNNGFFHGPLILYKHSELLNIIENMGSSHEIINKNLIRNEIGFEYLVGKLYKAGHFSFSFYGGLGIRGRYQHLFYNEDQKSGIGLNSVVSTTYNVNEGTAFYMYPTLHLGLAFGLIY